MKKGRDLVKYLNKIEKSIVNDLIEAQRKTAESICGDAQDFAPKDTGEYADSIHVTETEIKGNKISTGIITNATVVAKYNGNEYNLGYLLENGTAEHAIPNAFGLGYTYGYVDRYGYKHKGTMDKDWHPGTSINPHFIPALLLNKEVYDKEISKVLDKEFK